VVANTYRWCYEFGDFIVDFAKSLLGILELGKDGSEECFRTVHIMFC